MSFSRKKFLKSSLAASLGVSCPGVLYSMYGITDTKVLDLLNRICNTNNEKERVKLLEQVLQLDLTNTEKEVPPLHHGPQRE